MLTNLAVSLLLTVLLEELFALAWGLRGRWELTMVALMNCLTNPVVVLLHYTAVTLWRWSALPITATCRRSIRNFWLASKASHSTKHHRLNMTPTTGSVQPHSTPRCESKARKTPTGK